MDLEAPICEACGAPVPLCDGELATCVRCRTTRPIDAAHRELRRAAQAARERRREAEAKLRRLETRIPAWLPRVYARVGIPLIVIAVPLGFALTQARYGWFAREWVVLAGILPFMVALLPWLIMWALGNPQVYLDALGLRLRPAPARSGSVGVDCGVCGAPLEVELDAYAATCDYCGADSWVRERTGGHDHGADERREAANLADLLRGEQFQAFDIKQLLIIYPSVTALCCAGLYFMLPGRAELEAMRYRESVNYQWDRLGRPGAVVDLAVVDQGLIAVGADGRVQVYEDGEWQRIDDASDMLGVAAAGDRALLVGRRGQAAWLEHGSLSVIDRVTLGLGDDVDLHDAWLGADGSAAIVGARGNSAIFDGRSWRVLERTNDNDLIAVWGRSFRQLYAAGGVSVWTLSERQWSGELLYGLPLVVDVCGYGDAVYLATAPLGELDADSESSVWVDVYERKDDGWHLLAFSGTSFGALAVGPEQVWAVGADGYVQERGVAPLHPPGEGDLLAAVVWDGRLIVGGEDGVFVHTP